MKAILLGIGLVLGSAIACAQARSVAVSATSDDVIGQRLVYQVKEGIRKSSLMRYQESTANAVVVVHIVTMPGATGSSTVYSAAWTMGSEMWFYDHVVGVCGTDRVATCAEGLVAKTDALRERLAKK